MGYTVGILVGLAVAAAMLAATGWWRLAFAPFRIRTNRMTVHALQLHVPTEFVPRVDSILRSFAGGFNAMISAPSESTWQRYCDTLPTLFRPFAQEGAAMGYTVRRLFRYDPVDFEKRFVPAHPNFRYLHYVGLGFWSGMRRHDSSRLARIVAGLDPLYAYLCYDGYGFKHAFFDYPRNPAGLDPLDSLGGYARNAAYQGVGRAFFFYFMQVPRLLIERLDQLGSYAPDAAAGVGLASVFVFPNQLEIACELAARLPWSWHDHVHLGMCFGLKARSLNDPIQFQRDVDRLPAGVRDAVQAAVEQCDRIEAEVRAERVEVGYRCWRERVTRWMASRIEYPLAGVRSLNAAAQRRQAAGT
jgi:hypothetical protein